MQPYLQLSTEVLAMNTTPVTASIDERAASDLSAILIDRLLDWPFLGLLLVAVFVIIFRKELRDVLRNRKVEVEIAGNKLTIGEAVEEIERTTEDGIVSLQESVLGLEKRFDELFAATRGAQEVGNDSEAGRVAEAAAQPTAEDRSEIVWERVRKELLEGKYVWRTLERLALVSGSTREQVHEILASHPGEVKIGRGKSGRTIARHSTREPRD